MDFAKSVLGLGSPTGYSSRRVHGLFDMIDHICMYVVVSLIRLFIVFTIAPEDFSCLDCFVVLRDLS